MKEGEKMAVFAKTKYPNLKFLISEKGCSQKQIAEGIGIHPRTFCEKLKGQYPFTLDEAIKIKEIFFPGVSMDELYGTKV